MQNYSPFPTNLWGNASNFPIVLLLKYYHKSLFSFMEKKVLLVFLGNLCDICEKKTNITVSYREQVKGWEGKKESFDAEGNPYLCASVSDHVCVVVRVHEEVLDLHFKPCVLVGLWSHTLHFLSSKVCQCLCDTSPRVYYLLNQASSFKCSGLTFCLL